MRQQAEECPRGARVTTDPVVRMELLSAASWLHEKATRKRSSGMTTNEYRAKAKRLCEAAEEAWSLPHTREMLLDAAQAYERLANTTEKLDRQPLVN